MGGLTGVARVYVPFTLDRLASVVSSGEIGPAPFTAFTVTPEVVAQTPEYDDEQREHLVTLAAAQASLEQVVSDPATPWRRVVLAVDLEPESMSVSVVSSSPAAVEVTAAPGRDRLAALLVDASDVQREVALAAQTKDLESMDEVALLWFAASELVDLVV